MNIVARPIEPYPVVVLGWISAVLATIAACQGPQAELHELRESIAALHAKLDARPARKRAATPGWFGLR